MSGRLNFEYGFNTNNSQAIDDDTPMRVYLLGEFTLANRESDTPLNNKIIKIDIDNFDEVMTQLSPSITLPSGHVLTFNELEDFHPDSLFEHTIFNNLKRLKRELNNSATAVAAAEEIISSYQVRPEDIEGAQEGDLSANLDSERTKNVSIEKSDDMFERLLGQKQSSDTPSSVGDSAARTQGSTSIDAFLGGLISPHIIKDAKPEHTSLVVYIDVAIEELMQSVLHSKDFQVLESAWRGVRDVIFNEQYDEANQAFYLVNTDKSAVERAAAGDKRFVATLAQHIKNTDGEAHNVLIGNYQFSETDADINTLNALASFSEALGCQFVASASDSLINADADSLWQQFRQTPQAAHVALSYPKILMRIPYGKEQDEVDGFAFEEFREGHEHDKLLWGSSSFACARLLIRQYHAQGSLDNNITELPAFVFVKDGEKILQPCGEYLLSEQQLIDIRKKGLSVFASYRNKNSITLLGDGVKAVNV